jgi:hypothetical protein
MKLFAGAVILFFLVGAPTFAQQQQQDDRGKQQEQQAKQQKQTQKEQQARAKEQQKKQGTAQKEQQRQQKETAKQGNERAKQEQLQSKQQAKIRQEQQKNEAKQQRQPEKQQYAREERQQQPQPNERAQATPKTYHASDVHPRHGGRVISDRNYDAHFGRDHHFHAHWRHNADRFQYGGYWFTYTQPWPAMWSDNDNFYIVFNYDEDDYYLCDMEYPGVELLIIVQS